MILPSQEMLKNQLLASMVASDYMLLRPHLEAVALPRNWVLADADQPITHVWFLESGAGCNVASELVGRSAEVGLVGREGLIDCNALLGASTVHFRAMIQIPGAGHRVGIAPFRAALARSHALHLHLLRSVEATLLQVSYTAISNRSNSIEERLARWLLLCHDRSDSETLDVTHECLSLMLSVRRPSVTCAMHILEGENLVSARRGRITIRDRPGLESFAGPTYAQSALPRFEPHKEAA